MIPGFYPICRKSYASLGKTIHTACFAPSFTLVRSRVAQFRFAYLSHRRWSLTHTLFHRERAPYFDPLPEHSHALEVDTRVSAWSAASRKQVQVGWVRGSLSGTFIDTRRESPLPVSYTPTPSNTLFFYYLTLMLLSYPNRHAHTPITDPPPIGSTSML